MYAIVQASGHQHRVEPKSVIRLDGHTLGVGDRIELANVLLLQDEGGVRVGDPFIEGARVIGTVVEQGKTKKIRVFKYKSKKNYRRRYGHRSQFIAVRVDEITVEGV